MEGRAPLVHNEAGPGVPETERGAGVRPRTGGGNLKVLDMGAP